MDNNEFNSRFDIYYNNIASNAAPPVDPYEKSVFLTDAQRDIVLSIYNGREIPGLSFESTEEARRYLSSLIKDFSQQVGSSEGLIKLPQDLWFITKETAIINTDCDEVEAMVVPVRQDQLWRIKNNPFRGANDSRVLRVDTEKGVLLYSDSPIVMYNMTYLSYPTPIILESLEGTGLTIEGKTTSSSNVNPLLHKAILDRAVALAKMAYTSNINNNN